MKRQEESNTHHGSWEGLVNLMKVAGVPVTREHFLNLAYMGHPPEQLTPEQEEELPPSLRRDPVIHSTRK